jgi:hypothetical protein
MRAVWWKELRELLAPVIVLGVLGGIYAADAHWGLSSGDLLDLALVGGIALGVAHGVLDRVHRDDQFLLHRPVSLMRLHGGRALAGATACAAVVVVVVAVHAIALADRWRYGVTHRLSTPGVGYLTTSTAMFAAWAVVWAIIGARRRWWIFMLLVLVPFALRSTWGRTPSELAATLFLLAVAAAAAGLSIVTLAGRRTRLHAALLLLVIGFVTLETTTWLRAAWMQLQMKAYPYLAVKAKGEVLFWDRRGHEVEEYDTGRNLVRTRPVHEYPANKEQWLVVGAGPQFGPRLFDTPAWRHDPWRRWEWWQRSAESLLNHRQKPAPLRWRFDGSRFLCHDRMGNVVAGFGPDGYVRGPDAVEGRRFDARRRDRPAELTWVWIRKGVFQYIDRSSGNVLVFTIAEGPSEEPLEVTVATRPLDAPVKEELSLDSVPFQRFALGSQVVWLDRRGDVVLRVDLEAEEHYVSSWPLVRWEWAKVGSNTRREPREIKACAVVTRLGPVHPVSERLRVRVLRKGEPMVVQEVAIGPETLREHLCLVLQGTTGLIRPFPLALASFLAAPPQDWDELYSLFWVDPFFSGGVSGVWLLLSVALAAVCGWLARWQARLRCATERAVRFWTVAGVVLGPVGLLWMGFVVGRVLVEPVGTGRRAVNLERSPAVTEPWPEPLPTGTEVHA